MLLFNYCQLIDKPTIKKEKQAPKINIMPNTDKKSNNREFKKFLKTQTLFVISIVTICLKNMFEEYV